MNSGKGREGFSHRKSKCRNGPRPEDDPSATKTWLTRGKRGGVCLQKKKEKGPDFLRASPGKTEQPEETDEENVFRFIGDFRLTRKENGARGSQNGKKKNPVIARNVAPQQYPAQED